MTSASIPIPVTVDREIDTRGLRCPLPILKAKRSLNDMASGQLLRVISTDPGSLRDFEAFARQTGNELVEQQTQGDEFVHVLRRR
jgi:TusA-related sulfurtransferase